jgi:hypothetical protein
MDCLRGLRGRLVYGQTDHPHIHLVAAVDGTDERCPRPDDLGPGSDLVVALLNDHGLDENVNCTISAPAGTGFLSGQVLRCVANEQGEMTLKVSPLSVDRASCKVQLNCAAGEVVVLRFPLHGALDEGQTVVRQQFYSAQLFTQVHRQQDFASTISIPRETVAAAQHLRLRLAVEHLNQGTLLLNGESFILPPCVTVENSARIVDLALPVEALREENTVVLKLADSGSVPFHVICASLLVDLIDDK